MILSSTSDIIRVVTTGTPGIDVDAAWADITGAAPYVVADSLITKITSATTTTVIAAPGASTIRQVKPLVIRNIHATDPNTVTVEHYDGTNAAAVIKATLAAGQSLEYDGAKWLYLDASGGSIAFDLAGTINNATAKTTPVDADKFGFWDSVTGLLRMATWANFKTVLGALFAPLASPTFTGTVTLPKTTEIQDTSADHQYVLAVSELTADRTVTLPLLTGADTFVFAAHAQTLTNKSITRRVVTTTDDSTAVIDLAVTDIYELSAVANATTFSTTGSPVDGQHIIIRFKDAGVAKGLTWDAIFVAIGVTLPTTTVAGKWHYVAAEYNTAATKFHVLAVSVQA
jgi:hypothetical protein